MKKTFSLLGMISGVLAIILAVCVLCGVFSGDMSSGATSPFDSGYASFGADYYTYSVNNSAETASAANAAATNIASVFNLLQICLGLFMFVFGLIAVCGFGIVYAGCLLQPVATETDNEAEAENDFTVDEEAEEIDETGEIDDEEEKTENIVETN